MSVNGRRLGEGVATLSCAKFIWGNEIVVATKGLTRSRWPRGTGHRVAAILSVSEELVSDGRFTAARRRRENYRNRHLLEVLDLLANPFQLFLRRDYVLLDLSVARLAA